MTKEDIMKPENLVYQKPRLMNDNSMHYCPGCSHGVVHKLIAEVIDEMGLTEKAIGISPVGCAVFMYNYLDIDCQEAAHGRAPALASAIKRLWPDRLVFTYQGDGDLACIGTAESIHALNRGENINIIFIRYDNINIYIHIVFRIFTDPQNINIVRFKIIEHFLHLIRIQFHIIEKIIDLLNIKNALLLLSKCNQFFESFHEFLSNIFHCPSFLRCVKNAACLLYFILLK